MRALCQETIATHNQRFQLAHRLCPNLQTYADKLIFLLFVLIMHIHLFSFNDTPMWSEVDSGGIVSQLSFVVGSDRNAKSIVDVVPLWCTCVGPVTTWFYEHCGYISVPKKSGNGSNGSELKFAQPAPLEIFDDWQKAVLTTATLSGTISYLFMIYVLYSQYSAFKDTVFDNIKECTRSMWGKCGEKPLAEKSPGVLKSPFKDDSDQLEVSRLSPKQACYYMVIFLFIYCGNVALLFIIFDRSVDKDTGEHRCHGSHLPVCLTTLCNL